MSVSSKLPHWLPNTVTESKDKRFRHRFIKEDLTGRTEGLKELRVIVQNAHEDARKHLRALAGISLDPLNLGATSPARDPAEGYPERLHPMTLKGYLGEIFAAVLAEHFLPFDFDNWKVPAFLFRFHLVEFQQLESMRQTGADAKLRPGRTGDDCVAFQLDSSGRIIRSLYCESKCTYEHDTDLISDAHVKVGESEIVDIPQLIEVLKEKNDPESLQWVDALRQFWMHGVSRGYERFDLVCYVCGKSPVRGDRKTWMSVDRPHDKYRGGRKLEAVEVHLNDIAGILGEVYG
jgi:hypothetical protein